MPSRELQYRVSIDTGGARRQAASIRRAFEAELRQVSIGKINTDGLRDATNHARSLRNELDRAADEAERLNRVNRGGAGRGTGVAGVSGVGASLSGIGAAAATVGLSLGAAEIARGTIAMAQLGTQAIRTEKAFETLIGGSKNAADAIAAIKDASGGTVDSLKAMEIGNQALALGLAKTPEEFNRLVKAARAVALVSPVINDVGSAITEIGLASANLSFRRLDQLALSVDDVRSKMAELQAANSALTDSQAFYEAAVSSLLSKYGPVIDSEEARATALERIAAAARDATTETSKLVSTGVNAALNPVANAIEAEIETTRAIEQMAQNRARAYQLIEQGIQNADAVEQSYVDSLRETINAWQNGSLAADEYNFRINSLLSGLDAYGEAQSNATAAASESAEQMREQAIAAAEGSNAALALAQAMDSGAISANDYVAILSNLTGGIYAVADAANIASAALAGMGAMRAAVQSNLQTFGTANPYDTIYNMGGPSAGTGVPSLGIAGADPFNARMELLSKESDKLRQAAGYQAEQQRKAAAEAERAAKRAGKELESAAKKAAQDLRSALGSVPGLFGRSQVTQGQMDRANAGLPQNFADDYLRRLQDEVFNGKDWADVSIDEAKQALRDLGIQVADDNKIAFEQFAEAWENSVLFADEKNLRFINQEAVQLQLDLQEKAKQGQANIYKLFGVAVDEAVSAVGSGVGGGGGGARAAIPISGSLIPMGKDGTMPTLGGLSPVIDIEAIQGQLDSLVWKVVPEIDTTGMALTGDLRTALEPLAAQIAEQLKTSLAQEIGITKFDGDIVTPIADGLLRAINTELSANIEGFRREGGNVAELIKTSIAQAIGATKWEDGEAVTPIATGLITAINTQIRANIEGFRREGKTVSSSIMLGIANSWQETNANGQVTNSIAMGLLTAVNSQFDTTQNFFYAAGQTPAMSIMSGFAGTFAVGEDGRSKMVDPILTSITNGIRSNEENFRQRGGTIARAMVAGFNGEFSNENFKNTLIAAGETMGRYLEIGILAAINGGRLVEAIGAQVLSDIAETIEEPTQ